MSLAKLRLEATIFHVVAWILVAITKKYDKKERKKKKEQDSPKVGKINSTIFFSLSLFLSVCLSVFIYLSTRNSLRPFFEDVRAT